MRVLVTGGTGFVGSHLVEALLAQGHEVRCLARDTRRLGWISGLPSVTITQGDMDEPRSLLEGVRGMDQVYHVAGCPPVVYGPRDRGVLEVVRWVARGLLPMPAGPSRTLSLCYVQDLVTALLTAGEANVPSGEIFHVAGEGAFTWEQVGEALGEALGARPTPLRIPVPILLALASGADAWSWLAGRPGYFSRGKVREAAGHWLCDTGKARRQLGVVPSVGLSTGAAVTVKWYREAGWLQ